MVGARCRYYCLHEDNVEPRVGPPLVASGAVIISGVCEIIIVGVFVFFSSL